MDVQELKKQEARRARKEAEILLRHASTQLNKTAYEIDVLIEQFKMARIPLKRQTILNDAIKHLAANLIPNLGLAVLTQRFLHRSSCQSICLCRGSHFQRLVRASVVIEADPIPDHATGVLQGLEPVAARIAP